MQLILKELLKQDKPNASFLLGSGFSVPDGMRTVAELNEILDNLRLEDIYIHSDMTIILMNGQKKPMYLAHERDEMFFIDFIKSAPSRSI